MSLVLAFGLSPIGQAPAYADEPAQTQSAELQTQEDESAAATSQAAKQFGDIYYTVDGKEYKASADGSLAGPTYNGKANRTVEFAVLNGVGDDVEATNYDLVLVAPDGKTELTTGYKISDAGTYTIKVTGKGDTYKRQTAELKFTVSKLDLGTVYFTQDPAAGVPYNGTYQTIEFMLQAPFDSNDDVIDDVVKANFDAVDLEDTEITEFDYYSTDGKASEAEGADTGYIAKYDLQYGRDYTSNVLTERDVVSKSATLTGIGSCEKASYADLSIQKINLLSGDEGDKDENVTLNGSEEANQATIANEDATAGTVGEPGSFISVPFDKAANPITLKYKDVQLQERSDYKVDYYKFDAEKEYGIGDKYSPNAAPTTISEKYVAVITTVNGSLNFNGLTTITAYLKVDNSGDIESIAATATLPSGTYRAGLPVEAAATGAKFVAADGKTDVTSVIGDNYKTIGDYAIHGTNTNNAARLVDVEATETVAAHEAPAGAGEYYVMVTGDKNYTGVSDAEDAKIIARYTVEPAATTEGENVGQLKVTMPNAGYANGDFAKVSPKVEMYTVKGATPTEVKQTEPGVSGTVTNYTVTYKKDGQEITLPTEAGTYTATFHFSGNLQGTKDIEKTFQVSTGDVTTLISSIQVKNPDAETAEATPYVDPSFTYTGKTIELPKADVVFLDGDGNVVTADDLVGSDFTLSYSKASATPDAATGLPKNAGSYGLKATFTGNYTGEVEGILSVSKLNLLQVNTEGNKTVEVQYLQDDGKSYNKSYTTGVKSDGSAIVPTIRIAVVDGKEHSAEPTLVDEAVYSATFSDNTTAGSAKIALTSNEGSGNVTANSTPQANAFTIAGQSLSGIHAKVNLGAESASLADAYATGVTVTVSSDLGNLPYNATEKAYGIKVFLGGEEVSDDVDIAAGDAVNTDTATISKFPHAGEYTIVITAADENAKYGGWEPASFKVDPIDISKDGVYSFKFMAFSGSKAGKVLERSQDWAVGFDSVKAKKIEGITLDNSGVLEIANATNEAEVLQAFDADHSADYAYDYKVEYAENHAAGTATATITGAGDYTGTVVKEFAIERGTLPEFDSFEVNEGTDEEPEWVTHYVSGYRVNLIDSSLKDGTDGYKHATYNGLEQKPTYEVVYYEASEDGTTFAPKTKLTDSYEAIWYNNKNVSYSIERPGTVIANAKLAIRATGDYDGTLYATFQIDPIDLATAENVTIALDDVKYTGEANVIPTATVKLGDVELKQGADYQVISTNDGKVGPQTATIDTVSTGNITVSTPIAKTFNIVKGDSKVTLAAKSFTYTGKAIAMSGAKVTGSTGAVTYKYYSDAKATKEISAPKNGGTYYAVATVAADDNYAEASSAAAKVTIKQAANTKFKVTAKKKSYAAKTTAKKAFKASALYKVTGKAGKVTYKKANTAGAKKIVVAKNGKITVKKGLKAGTYKVKVKATSAANANYKAASKTVTIKVKVTKK